MFWYNTIVFTFLLINFLIYFLQKYQKRKKQDISYNDRRLIRILITHYRPVVVSVLLICIMSIQYFYSSQIKSNSKKFYRYSFINNSGQLVLPMQFNKVWPPINQGLILVEVPFLGLRDSSSNWHFNFPCVKKSPLRFYRRKAYIDMEGKIAINPTCYTFAGSFSEGLAYVRQENKKSGYINTLGKMAIELKLEAGNPFYEGVAEAKQNSKWGLINSSGNWLVKPQFENIHRQISPTSYCSPLERGIFRVQLNEKWGIITKKGNYLIPPKFDRISSIHEGYVRVEVGNKYGFVRILDGNSVVPIQFEKNRKQCSESYFSEGLAPVSFGQGKYGYISPESKLIIDLKFDNACPFQEGLAAVQLQGLWGYIDSSGKIIIPCQFQKANAFIGGMAQVVEKGNVIFIDSIGNRLNKTEILEIDYGKYCQKSSDFLLVKKNINGRNIYQYVNKKYNNIFNSQFEHAQPFWENFALVQKKERLYYIDQEGKLSIKLPPNIIYADNFSYGLACIAQQENLFFYLWHEIYPPLFDTSQKQEL